MKRWEAITNVTIKVHKYSTAPLGCSSTVFDDWTMPDMVTSVQGTAALQTLSVVKDSISREYGNKDGTSYCGARSF